NADFASEWAPQFGQRLHRHIYAHDVVPHLPPAWFGRFVHFGSELVAGSPNEPWRIAKTPLRQARLLVVAAASCATSFLTRRLPVLDLVPFPYSLDDHSPARYLEVSRASLTAS